MANFLNTDGLSALWAKIKSKFYTKTEVDAAIPSASTTAPFMDGTATIGSSTNYARADHIHPSDTSRVAVAQGIVNAGKYLKVNNSGNVAVADLDTEVLVVTFIYDRYENNNYVYIADKSNTEITNAYSAGKIVMGKMQNGSGAYFFNGGGFFATQPDEDYPIISYFYYYGSDYEYFGDFISLIDSSRFYNSVLTKTNTDSYTPSSDYNPATKKYVDDNVGVTSFNGNTGAITYTAPVTSVNGKTGNVKTYIEGVATISGNSVSLTGLSVADIVNAVENKVQVIYLHDDDGEYQKYYLVYADIGSTSSFEFASFVDGTTMKRIVTTRTTSTSSNTTITGTLYLKIIPPAATVAPNMDGVAAIGTAATYAKGDHVHPSDTSKANVTDVLSKTNTTSYTPTADYHPATKKYVDEHGGNTYALSMNNNVITLTGSDSSTSSATLPVFGGTSADVWEGGVY